MAMRILLVDDDERVRRTLGRQLAAMTDVEVVVEEDANSAIGQAHAWRPHLVLVDLLMPGIDGVRCALALRTLDAALPIAFVTGHVESFLATEARAIAATVLVPKPCTPDVLTTLVETFRPSVQIESL